jgi:hypothetical protein
MTAMAEEQPDPGRQLPVLRFRIDDIVPELAVVGRPQGHRLKLWMNKAAAIQLAHGLLDVAAGMPSTPDGVAILQWGGLKMPRGAEVSVENAPDSPARVSPILAASGDQIVRGAG